MEYIASLRKYVGHAPILMVGVAALIMDEDFQVLLMHRTDNFCWGPPGGSTEPGERLDEALRREVFEETGNEISEVTLFDVFSGPELNYTYPNGDQVFNVTIVYMTKLASNASSEIRLDHEHSEWGWFKLNDIPKNISPPMIPVMNRFVQQFTQ